MLALDAGGLLFKTTSLDQRQAPQDKAAARGIAETYQAMAIDAVGITAYELAAGLDFFRDLTRETPLPWLSADLVDSATGKPLFISSIIKKAGDLTIGVFGLSGPAAAAKLGPQDHARLLPWQDAAPPLISQLNSSADLIILLSALPEKDNELLAQRHPDLHLIIRAGSDAVNLPPRLINNTLILQAEKQGKHLGVLEIDWTASKRWGEDQGKLLTQKKNELDRVEWLIRSHERYGDPQERYREAPAKLQAYQELLGDRQRLHREIGELEQSLARRGSAPAALAENRFLAMTTELPDHPAVLELVEKTTITINALGKELAKKQLEAEKSATGRDLPYVGWQKCAECHRTEADFWRQSRHARAYETLRAKNQQYNLECIACHVTGLTSGNEPYALALPADLQAVGCEVCHGPGRGHSDTPSRPMISKPAPAVCLRCHTPEQDDNFDYDRDRARLNCPHVRP